MTKQLGLGGQPVELREPGDNDLAQPTGCAIPHSAAVWTIVPGVELAEPSATLGMDRALDDFAVGLDPASDAAQFSFWDLGFTVICGIVPLGVMFAAGCPVCAELLVAFIASAIGWLGTTAQRSG